MNDLQESSGSNFLLVGNGSYQNRGCEAILRGTMEILRHEFGPDLVIDAGVFSAREKVLAQAATEKDPSVRSFPLTLPGGPRWSIPWFLERANQRLGAEFHPHVKDIAKASISAVAALQVGGDHYSLDYGKPLAFMAMDDFLISRGVPVVLWGVSVGPFDSDPAFSRRMFKHLARLDGIFVRESRSQNYLKENGVSDNVHLMGDPAFVMEPVATAKDGSSPAWEGAVGINLSPMLAFYRGLHPAEVDLDHWRAFCAELVRVAGKHGRPILLVPHVGSDDSGNDDFAFLDSVCASVAHDVGVPIHVLPRGLSAAESKWAISRCSVFVGGRTHSTIAALSTHVPTLSIAYSQKAQGINMDVYGHLGNCVSAVDLTVDEFTCRLSSLMEDEVGIRRQLEASVPLIANRAMAAGASLRGIIGRKKIK